MPEWLVKHLDTVDREYGIAMALHADEVFYGSDRSCAEALSRMNSVKRIYKSIPKELWDERERNKAKLKAADLRAQADALEARS
jgi:hypothetical protein